MGACIYFRERKVKEETRISANLPKSNKFYVRPRSERINVNHPLQPPNILGTQ